MLNNNILTLKYFGDFFGGDETKIEIDLIFELKHSVSKIGT